VCKSSSNDGQTPGKRRAFGKPNKRFLFPLFSFLDLEGGDNVEGLSIQNVVNGPSNSFSISSELLR
jgi:hypothetical protein